LINNPLEEIQLLNNIGTTYINLGLYGKAQEVFEMNLKNPDSDKLMVIVSTKNLGKVYFEKKEYQEAKVFLKKVEKLGTLKKELKLVIEKIIPVLISLGKNNKVNTYFEKYTQLKLELSKNSKEQTIKAIQFKFEIKICSSR